jgi:hypothetical protein
MKILAAILLFLFSLSVFGATAEYKQGALVDQYKIIDVGGPNNNNLIFISHKVNELVIQVSSVDTHTSKEALLCWEDNSILECPDDDLDPPNEVWRMPVMKQLNDIMVEGGVTYVGDLTDLAEKSIYLAFWFEYVGHNVFQDALAEMILEGLNELQQRRSLKYVIFGNGIDLTTSQAIANNWITNGIQPTYDDLGLATIPLQYRRVLKLFGEVGWFE